MKVVKTCVYFCIDSTSSGNLGTWQCVVSPPLFEYQGIICLPASIRWLVPFALQFLASSLSLHRSTITISLSFHGIATVIAITWMTPFSVLISPFSAPDLTWRSRGNPCSSRTNQLDLQPTRPQLLPNHKIAQEAQPRIKRPDTGKIPDLCRYRLPVLYQPKTSTRNSECEAGNNPELTDYRCWAQVIWCKHKYYLIIRISPR